jgi:general secretion pathway protein M
MKWLEALEARWQAWWPELDPREQRMVIVAGAPILLALLWWVALAPALRTLSSAPAEHAQIDAQLQRMTQLQTQARALQAQPRASRDDAMRGLETSVRQTLGPNAQMQPGGAGEGVTIALRAAPADALAQWFAQARTNARAVPREVHLTRSQGNSQPTPAPPSSSAPKAAGDSSRVRWDGTMVMSLPAR